LLKNPESFITKITLLKDINITDINYTEEIKQLTANLTKNITDDLTPFRRKSY
jgi:hypothetical protein